MSGDSCPCKPCTPAVIGAVGVMIRPYGDYSFTELIKLYEDKISALSGEFDYFLLEGMTMLADLRAASLACHKTGKPVCAVIDIDEEFLTENELPADAALITLQSIGISCFGVSSAEEETLTDCVLRLRPFAKIPLAVKLRGGTFSDSAITALLSAGVDKFIGLTEECSARAEKIGAERAFGQQNFEPVDSIMLANERQAFFLEPDTTEISEGFSCSPGMGEDLYEACDCGYDVLKIQINTPEDAIDFAENAHMAVLPVMFSGDDEIAMKLALMLYQGRALIDRESLIDEEELKSAAEKYGAVIY